MTQPRHHSRDHGADRAPASDALDRLADAFVDDILSMSDDEVIAEIIEDGEDPAAIADQMRGLFEDVLQATAGRVLAHPSGKSSNAHSNAPSVVRDQHHATRGQKSCPFDASNGQKT